MNGGHFFIMPVILKSLTEFAEGGEEWVLSLGA